MLISYFGILSGMVFISTVLLLGLITPGYSQFRDYTSDLGGSDAKYKGFMNFLGFGVTGLLLLLFSIFLFTNVFTIDRSMFGTGASLFLFLASLAWILIGFFPVSLTDRKDKISKIHKRIVNTSNLFAVVSLLGFGIHFLTVNIWFLGVLSLVVVPIILSKLFINVDVAGAYKGLFQKLFILIFLIWVITVNIYFIL